jgi:hypothetical protein
LPPQVPGKEAIRKKIVELSGGAAAAGGAGLSEEQLATLLVNYAVWLSKLASAELEFKGRLLGLAVEVLNASPADDTETRYRCGDCFSQWFRSNGASAASSSTLVARSAKKTACLAARLHLCTPAAGLAVFVPPDTASACAPPCRALVAVGTLAGEHSRVRQLARELGFLSLADSLKGGGGKVGEAAAEVAQKLRL